MAENVATVPFDPDTLYVWGVFRDSNRIIYVNRYIKTESYPAMVKGGFPTKADAEKFLASMEAVAK